MQETTSTTVPVPPELAGDAERLRQLNEGAKNFGLGG